MVVGVTPNFYGRYLTFMADTITQIKYVPVSIYYHGVHHFLNSYRHWQHSHAANKQYSLNLKQVSVSHELDRSEKTAARVRTQVTITYIIFPCKPV